MTRILLVDDDERIRSIVREYAQAEDWVFEEAGDGEEALRLFAAGSFSLVVLDVMMPRMNGIEALRIIRQASRVPVIMLTARDELPDKIAGFRAGADDYLTKPFALPELEVRLEALLARASGRQRSKVLEVEDLRLDLTTLEASRGGQPLHLYPACRKLLEVLMQASPAAVNRERLEQAVWGEDPPDGDMLRSHVYELRRSFDEQLKIKQIHTLPRVGYRLAALHEDSRHDA